MHGRAPAPPKEKAYKAVDSVATPSWQNSLKKDLPPPPATPPRTRSPSNPPISAHRVRSPSSPAIQPAPPSGPPPPVPGTASPSTHTPSLFERLRARSPAPSRTRTATATEISAATSAAGVGEQVQVVGGNASDENAEEPSHPPLHMRAASIESERRPVEPSFQPIQRRTSRASEFANRILRRQSISLDDARKVKFTSELLSTDAKINGNTKFSSMTNNVGAVYEQAVTGAKVTGAFRDLYARLARHEAKYARKLETILAEEGAKIAKAMESDKVRGYANVWGTTAGALRSTVDSGYKASSAIESEVVGTLSTLERHAQTKLKEIGALVGKHEQETNKAVDAIQKSQDEVTKAVSLVELNKDKSDSAQYQLKLASLKIQAAEHAEKLQETNRQLEFSAEGQAMLLDELQILETQRIQSLLSSMESFITAKKTIQGPLETVNDVLKNTNATQCIHMFVADWVSEFGPCVKREVVNTISADQIDQMLTQTQVFEVPLVQLLQRERRTQSPVRDVDGHLRLRAKSLFDCPGKHGINYKIITEEGYACDVCDEKNIPLGDKMQACTLCNFYVCQDCYSRPAPVSMGQKQDEVPLVLATLCQAIRDLGGLTAEGIFRISVDSGLLNNLRTQFNAGNFSLDAMKNNPHAAACLLKMWLRALPDPVMPRNVYADTIETFHRNGGTGKFGEDVCLRVYRQLSIPYQALLKTILQLCQEVVAQSSVNRMSYEALSVVFTPCLFEPAMGTDATQVIMQSRQEQKFLFDFFTILCEKQATGTL